MLQGDFSNGKTIKDTVITKEAVEKKLKALISDKAQGPDQIPLRVLKE